VPVRVGVVDQARLQHLGLGHAVFGAGFVGGGGEVAIGAGLRGLEGRLGGGFLCRVAGAGEGLLGGLDLGDALGQVVGGDFLGSSFVGQGARFILVGRPRPSLDLNQVSVCLDGHHYYPLIAITNS